MRSTRILAALALFFGLALCLETACSGTTELRRVDPLACKNEPIPPDTFMVPHRYYDTLTVVTIEAAAGATVGDTITAQVEWGWPRTQEHCWTVAEWRLWVGPNFPH